MSAKSAIYLAGTGIHDPTIRLIASQLAPSTGVGDFKVLFNKYRQLAAFTATGSQLEYSNVVSSRNGWRKTVTLESDMIKGKSTTPLPGVGVTKDIILPSYSFAATMRDLKDFEDIMDKDTNLIFVNSIFGVTESCIQEFWKNKDSSQKPRFFDISSTNIVRSSFGYRVNHIREGTLTLSRLRDWSSIQPRDRQLDVPQHFRERGESPHLLQDQELESDIDQGSALHHEELQKIMQQDDSHIPTAFNVIHESKFLNSISVPYEDKLKQQIENLIIESCVYPFMCMFECSPKNISKSKYATELISKLLVESVNSIQNLPYVQHIKAQDPALAYVLSLTRLQRILKRQTSTKLVQKLDLVELIQRSSVITGNIVQLSKVAHVNAKTHQTLLKMIKFQQQLRGIREFAYGDDPEF